MSVGLHIALGSVSRLDDGGGSGGSEHRTPSTRTKSASPVSEQNSSITLAFRFRYATAIGFFWPCRSSASVSRRGFVRLVLAASAPPMSRNIRFLSSGRMVFYVLRPNHHRDRTCTAQSRLESSRFPMIQFQSSIHAGMTMYCERQLEATEHGCRSSVPTTAGEWSCRRRTDPDTFFDTPTLHLSSGGGSVKAPYPL